MYAEVYRSSFERLIAKSTHESLVTMASGTDFPLKGIILTLKEISRNSEILRKRSNHPINIFDMKRITDTCNLQDLRGLSDLYAYSDLRYRKSNNFHAKKIAQND